MPKEIVLVNPRRRKRRKNPARKSVARRSKRSISRRRRKRNPAVSVKRSMRRRRRRNPLNTTSLKTDVISSATGAIGALSLDVAFGFLPLPDTVKTGQMGNIAKAAGAVGLGMLTEKMLGKKAGHDVTRGTLTIVGYNILKDLVQTAMPTLALGEYVQPYNTFGEYLNPPDTQDSFGFVNSGEVVYDDAGFDDGM